MENLPPALLIEILNKLDESTDLARCRVASKTLNSLSYHIQSLHIFCSSDRYRKSRAPQTKARVTPFKTIIKNLLLQSKVLQCISIGLENCFPRSIEAGDAELDDLYLTSVDFVSEWLPKIAGQLRSLSISDFFVQAYTRRSGILGVICDCCDKLYSLELKNNWLSADKLEPMPMLTSLTLDSVRLDDEDLNKLNDCFPSLQVLNLIRVGSLRYPKIHLLHLKSCQLTLYTALSLSIYAPSLLELKLICDKPEVLVIRAPILSVFDFSIQKASGTLEVERFLNLKCLKIVSSDLHGLEQMFRDCSTVEKLVLWVKVLNSVHFHEQISFEELVSAFPSIGTSVLGPLASVELIENFCHRDSSSRFGRESLKELLLEIESTWSFLCSMLDKCTPLSDVEVLIRGNFVDDIMHQLISKCIGDYPTVRWKLDVAWFGRRI